MAISDQAQKTIRDFLEVWWNDLRWKAGQTMLGVELPIVMPDDLYGSGFGDVLRQMAAGAEGLLPHDEIQTGEVYECCQQLSEWMFARPGMPGSYTIPQEFWMTPIGDLCLRAMLWLEGDDLISMSDAAKLSGRSLSALSQLANRGKITIYPDPNEPNPTRRSRVKRSAAKALKKPVVKRKR